MTLYHLTEIGDIVTGTTPKKSLKNAYGNVVPFLTPSDYKGTRMTVKTARSLSDNGLIALKSRLLSPNSISVTSIGSNMGKTQYNPTPLVTNQQINSIHNINEKFVPLYIYYKLISLHDFLYNLGSGNGSTMPILNKTDFSKIEVDIPEKKIQEKVVSLLDPIDSKIELLHNINDNLLYIAETIFKQKFPNIEKGQKSIKNYLLPKRGKGLLAKDARPGKIPVVAGGLSPATKHDTANTKAPVITISASGANAGYINIWMKPIWSSDSSFIDSTITDNVYFWYVLLKSRQQEIFDMQTGSAQPHIYPKHIGIMPIREINTKDIVEFNHLITPFFDTIANNLEEISTLSTTRDVLLKKMLS